MQLQANEPASFEDLELVPLDGLVRTHWSLAVCVVCGHEQPRGARCRASCPGCGAQLRTFSLYRALRADQ
jgi:hypothetical protein